MRFTFSERVKTTIQTVAWVALKAFVVFMLALSLFMVGKQLFSAPNIEMKQNEHAP